MLQKGIAAAPGIVIGRAVVQKDEMVRYERRILDQDEVAPELGRFRESVRAADLELEQV